MTIKLLIDNHHNLIKGDAEELEIDTKQVARYAKTNNLNDFPVENLKRAVRNWSHPKAVYVTVTVEIEGDIVKLDDKVFKSKDLAKFLQGCSSAIVFGATLGSMLDERVRLTPGEAKKLILDAMGTQAIEEFCDVIQEVLTKGSTKKRYSPGYGDLNLSTQATIYEMLELGEAIGVALKPNCFMYPSKTVTAIIGVKDEF